MSIEKDNTNFEQSKEVWDSSDYLAFNMPLRLRMENDVSILNKAFKKVTAWTTSKQDMVMLLESDTSCYCVPLPLSSRKK